MIVLVQFSEASYKKAAAQEHQESLYSDACPFELSQGHISFRVLLSTHYIKRVTSLKRINNNKIVQNCQEESLTDYHVRSMILNGKVYSKVQLYPFCVVVNSKCGVVNQIKVVAN